MKTLIQAVMAVAIILMIFTSISYSQSVSFDTDDDPIRIYAAEGSVRMYSDSELTTRLATSKFKATVSGTYDHDDDTETDEVSYGIQYRVIAYEEDNTDHQYFHIRPHLSRTRANPRLTLVNTDGLDTDAQWGETERGQREYNAYFRAYVTYAHGDLEDVLDEEGNPIYDEVHLSLELIDANDEHPTFFINGLPYTENTKTVDVFHEAPVGTTLLTLFAKDRDVQTSAISYRSGYAPDYTGDKRLEVVGGATLGDAFPVNASSISIRISESIVNAPRSPSHKILINAYTDDEYVGPGILDYGNAGISTFVVYVDVRLEKPVLRVTTITSNFVAGDPITISFLLYDSISNAINYPDVDLQFEIIKAPHTDHSLSQSQGTTGSNGTFRITLNTGQYGGEYQLKVSVPSITLYGYSPTVDPVIHTINVPGPEPPVTTTAEHTHDAITHTHDDYVEHTHDAITHDGELHTGNHHEDFDHSAVATNPPPPPEHTHDAITHSHDNYVEHTHDAVTHEGESHTENHHGDYDHSGIAINPPPPVEHTHDAITHSHDNYVEHTHPAITHSGAAHTGNHHSTLDHSSVAINPPPEHTHGAITHSHDNYVQHTHPAITHSGTSHSGDHHNTLDHSGVDIIPPTPVEHTHAAITHTHDNYVQHTHPAITHSGTSHSGNHHLTLDHSGVATNPPPVDPQPDPEPDPQPDPEPDPQPDPEPDPQPETHTHSEVTHTHDNYVQHTHPAITHSGAAHTGDHHDHSNVGTNPPPVVEHTHAAITHTHDNYVQHTHPAITHDGEAHDGDHHDHSTVAQQEEVISVDPTIDNVDASDKSFVEFGSNSIQGGIEIRITWDTETETNIIGFHVYRKINGEDDNQYIKLTDDPMPSSSSPYEYLDSDKVPNTHYIYRVVAIPNDDESDTSINLIINPNRPLPVTLSLFNVRLQDGSALIKWVTESEIDNAGFNIYRSTTRKGKYVKVNDKLIIGKGTTSKRSKYEFTDHTIKKGIVYYYLIEDVSFAGHKTQIVVARMKGYINSRSKLIVKWAQVK